MTAESVLLLVVSALVVSCCCVSAQRNDTWVISERSSGQKQYKIYTTFQLNYYEAEAHCYNEDKVLASIDSQVEQEILTELIKETKLPSVNLWTSGSDLAEYDRWVWGYTGRPLTYTNWRKDRPNHRVDKGEVPHCIRVEADQNYQWNDWYCSRKGYVACEV